MSDTEKRIPYKAFIAASARAFLVSAESIVAQNRKVRVVRARQAAALLIRTHRPDLSMPEIGRRLGGKDHTTILHGINQAKRHLQLSAAFRECFEAAERDALSWAPDRSPPLVFIMPPAKALPEPQTPPAVKYARPTSPPDFWGGMEPLENKLMRRALTQSTVAMADRMEKAAAKREVKAQ